MIEQLQPCVRSAWSKFTLATLKRYPHEDRTKIADAVTPTVRAEIRAADTLSWQDARVFMALCGQIALCGEVTAQGFWRHSLLASIKQPLIGTLVQGGMALWGKTPVALFARTPRAYSLVSRGCGEMRMEPGRDSHQVHMFAFDLPVVCREHEGILRMWEGGFRGQADFVGCTAAVTTDASRFAPEGKVQFTIRW